MPDAAELDGVSILLVDDLAANRKLLGRLLDGLGCTILQAASGAEAIEAFRRHDPDIILMDIRMPGMDGKQAAAEIRRLSGRRYTPILFITAYQAEENLAESLNAGGDDYLNKPVERQTLVAKIRAHNRIRQLNTELSYHNERLNYEQSLMQDFFDNAAGMADLDVGFLRYYLSPASTFNGDLLLCKRRPDGRYNLIVGDFTGHGLTAAMGTVPLTMIFSRMVERSLDSSTIVEEINHQLHRLLPRQLFCAAALLEIDLEAHRLNIWSGGLPPIYIKHGRDGSLSRVKPRHPPLGILGQDSFDVAFTELQLQHCDRVYVYTDGLIECNNGQGEEFGSERLERLLGDSHGDFIDRIIHQHDRHCTANLHRDDITIAEITF